MPRGNPPSAQLSLYVVFSEGIGQFGPSLREITRVGLNEQRFVKGANRGDPSIISAIHFTENEEEAKEFIQLVEDLQGSELTLRSTSTEKDWTIFLRSSTSFYKPFVGTDPTRNYIIRFQLNAQRTK